MVRSSQCHIYIYTSKILGSHGSCVSRLKVCIIVRVFNKVCLPSVSLLCVFGLLCECSCHRRSFPSSLYVHVKENMLVRCPHQNKQLVTNRRALVGLHNKWENEKDREKDSAKRVREWQSERRRVTKCKERVREQEHMRHRAWSV